MKSLSLSSFLRKVHQDEDGSVSLETVLILGAIALPILIFLIKVGWPTVQNYFNTGLQTLQQDGTKRKTSRCLGGAMLTTILLFGWVLTATVTDTVRHKIYNWTTYTGIFAALSVSAVGSVVLTGAYLDEEGLRGLGWISLRESLLGC